MIGIGYVILLIIGSVVVGFALGFLSFSIYNVIKDWSLKRKMRKQTPNDMLKPEIQKIQKEVIENDIRTDESREYNEYREFEKLRAIAKGERRNDNGDERTTDGNGNERRSQISFNSDSNIKPNKPNFDVY